MDSLGGQTVTHANGNADAEFVVPAGDTSPEAQHMNDSDVEPEGDSAIESAGQSAVDSAPAVVPAAESPHGSRFAHSSRRAPDHESILIANAGGPNPDRLLVVGGAVGRGRTAATDDHELATRLAQALTQLTGRGTNIDVLVAPDISDPRVHSVVDRRRMLLLDAIIVVPGDINARLPPIASQTRRRVDSMLNHIRHQAPASLHVFVVGAPELSATAPIPRPLRWLAQHSITQINRALDAACTHRENVELISLSEGQLTAIPGTPTSPSLDPLYIIWAHTIATAVSAYLEPRSSSRG
jgi:hypothetical protein